MFGGSLSPPGFEPSSTKQKRCDVPTVLRRDAFCSVAMTCSALYLCLPLSLSLYVSRSLSPSSPLFCSLSSPSPGVFPCASAASYTPLLAVPCQAYRRSHGGVLSGV